MCPASKEMMRSNIKHQSKLRVCKRISTKKLSSFEVMLELYNKFQQQRKTESECKRARATRNLGTTHQILWPRFEHLRRRRNNLRQRLCCCCHRTYTTWHPHHFWTWSKPYQRLMYGDLQSPPRPSTMVFHTLLSPRATNSVAWPTGPMMERTRNVEEDSNITGTTEVCIYSLSRNVWRKKYGVSALRRRTLGRPSKEGDQKTLTTYMAILHTSNL